MNHNTKTPSAGHAGLISRVFLILAIGLIYFWQLGNRGLGQSEDRWAEIARNMLLTGDYFHPIMNAEVYFDKPLISYWFIAWVAALCGQINEWVTRFPSVVMGILALVAVYRLAKPHWSERTAWLAVWITLTSFGVIFWSRTAAADMANATLSLVAIAWFYNNKDKPTLLNYFIFYFICIVGAQTKGLGALAVPVLAVVPYLLYNQAWKRHLNLPHLIAGLLCAGLYFLPFYVASATALPAGYTHPSHGMSGLYLVYKENIQRFVDPFDHTGGISTYFTGLPYILLPWAPLLVAALYSQFRNWKQLSADSRWLLQAIVLIFIFFSLSGSRRWYYILPLAPLCALLIADYLNSNFNDQLKRVAVILIELMWAAATVVFLCSPLLWPLAEQKQLVVPEGLRISTLVIGILSLAVWLVRFVKPLLLQKLTGTHPMVSGVIVLTVLFWGGWFGFQNESLDTLRTERAFALELKQQLKPGDNLVFYKNAVPKIVFYINSPTPFRMIDNPEELAQAVKQGPMLLVAEQKRLPVIMQALGVEKMPEPILREQIHPWEQKPKTLEKKLAVWAVGSPP